MPNAFIHSIINPISVVLKCFITIPAFLFLRKPYASPSFNPLLTENAFCNCIFKINVKNETH